MKRAPKPPVPLEEEEQRNLLQWATVASRQTPVLGLLFHIANGGHRHPAVAKKLRAAGVKPGVPDLFLPVARYLYHGLFIELKRRGGGTTGVTQKQWHAALRAQGYDVAVANGWIEARDVILNYLRIPA